MNLKKFEEIMSKNRRFYSGDGYFEGLVIIKRYLPDSQSLSAVSDGHAHSVDGDDLVEVGISEDDTKKLASLGWQFDEDVGNLCYEP
ncbi:hypothetical protein ACFL08_00550 [Patescibacteria group bacterium]